MDGQEYEDWVALNRLAGPANALSPCADCSLGFAVEMRLEGRCDSRPRGIPDADDDTGWFHERHTGFAYTAVRRSAEVRAERKSERAKQAMALSKQGMKRREIGAVLGVNIWTVGEYLRMERTA